MDEDKNKHLFLSLVYSFQMQTMIQLGKIMNPVTNKAERELEAAQMTIDMLDMLKAKTLNNVTEDETRFLEQVISDLKLNFVEEKEKSASEISGEKSQTETSGKIAESDSETKN
jgi:hypothetical protein